MISYRLVNFVPPGAAQTLKLNTPCGVWTFEKDANFNDAQKAMAKGQCAETYIVDHPVSMRDGATACDEAVNEMTPILLAASYFLGLSVTAKRSTPFSEMMILRPSDHWPRERAMGEGTPLVDSDSALIGQMELFVRAWKSAGQAEKALLLVHHWLDALACWSFEDMYLSATTLLQVVAATEETRQGKSLSFLQGVTGASNRFGVTPLSADFKNMRNDLVHDGTLPQGVVLQTARPNRMTFCWTRCAIGDKVCVRSVKRHFGLPRDFFDPFQEAGSTYR